MFAITACCETNGAANLSPSAGTKGRPGICGGRDNCAAPGAGDTSEGRSSITRGNLPSKLGSKARMRSTKGGWVAKSESPKPLAKNKWLASSACGELILEPEVSPPIFLSAPANPDGLRVNCTAEASARTSR